MQFGQILDAVNVGLEYAERLVPIAEAFGGEHVSHALNAAATAIEVANNVIARIAEGKIVASSAEADEIGSIIKKLQEVNDRLAAVIATS